MSDMITEHAVLDHGFVRLVDFMGDDNSVIQSARVSHAANEKTGLNPDGDFRLMDYLYRHGHTSPFEHVQFTFHVKAPIFVFRQWHRHRTWSFNEISARYTELPEEYYVPQANHIGIQSMTNHQSRDFDTALTGEEWQEANELRAVIDDCNSGTFAIYRDLLARGVPREIARSVLPVGTYSEMFASIDLHNLFKFIKERTHPGAQYEIKVYAEAMLELIEPLVPAAVSVYKAHNSQEKSDA